MKHYRFHNAYITKKILKRVSDTVEFFQKENMPKMYPTDATICAERDLIDTIQNPAPEIPLVKIGYTHKKALIFQAKIFIKAPPAPTVPRRLSVRG